TNASEKLARARGTIANGQRLLAQSAGELDDERSAALALRALAREQDSARAWPRAGDSQAAAARDGAAPTNGTAQAKAADLRLGGSTTGQAEASASSSDGAGIASVAPATAGEGLAGKQSAPETGAATQGTAALLRELDAVAIPGPRSANTSSLAVTGAASLPASGTEGFSSSA